MLDTQTYTQEKYYEKTGSEFHLGPGFVCCQSWINSRKPQLAPIPLISFTVPFLWYYLSFKVSIVRIASERYFCAV